MANEGPVHSYYRNIICYILIILGTLVLLAWPLFKETADGTDKSDSLNILTYSSFATQWGAGPAISKLFTEKTGIPVRWIPAGNAGLILERLRFKRKADRADLVLGLDQYAVEEARARHQWLDVSDIYNSIQQSSLPEGARIPDFFAFDWGVLSFVYRQGEVEPPRSLDDLVTREYSKKLILQDPRMSSPGLHFLFWVLSVKGEEEGFLFLEKLKKSIHMLSPSWSSSYSIFKVSKERLVFSYAMSPYYHLWEENDDSYRVAEFSSPLPVHIEYAGIPDFCNHCQWAQQFLEFLGSEEAQQLLLEKNLMFPVNKIVLNKKTIKLANFMEKFSPLETFEFVKNKKKIIERWKKIFY